MKRVPLTGKSRVGKSTVIAELATRGFRAIDADEGGLAEFVSVPEDESAKLEPRQDWVWRAGRIRLLQSEYDADVLFLGGCSPNQGRFYSQLETVQPLPRRGAGHVVDTDAPLDQVVETVLGLVGERS